MAYTKSFDLTLQGETILDFGKEAGWFFISNRSSNSIYLHLQTTKDVFDNVGILIEPEEIDRKIEVPTDKIKLVAGAASNCNVTAVLAPKIITPFPTQVDGILKNIPGLSFKQFYAFITPTTTGKQIFSQLGYKEQGTAAQRSIKSTNSNDSQNGTGVQEVLVKYIRSDGTEGQETVILGGLNPVNLNEIDIQNVNEIRATKVGAGGVAAGDIKLLDGADGLGDMIAGIPAGSLRNLDLIYYLPNDKCLILDHFLICGTKNTTQFFFSKTNRVTDGADIFGEVYRGFFSNPPHKIDGFVSAIPAGGKFKVEYSPDNNGDKYLIIMRGWIKDGDL